MSVIIPHAKADPRSVWPLAMRLGTPQATLLRAFDVPHAGSRRFGAQREGGKRWTIGTTLRWPSESDLVSPLDAILIWKVPHWMPDEQAIYLRSPGLFIGIGGIPKGNPELREAKLGDRYAAGETIVHGDLHHPSPRALHFQLFVREHGIADSEFIAALRAGEFVWRNVIPHTWIRDPTSFLDDAARRAR